MGIFRVKPIALSLALALAAAPVSAQGTQFNLTGVTVYDTAEILGYAAQVVVQRTGTVTAEDLAQTLEIMYREDGYFLAEVFVADDGQTLVVDEGQIGDVSIEGVDEPTYRLIRSYVEPIVGRRAVTQKEFERAIMLVEDIEAISATAEIDYPEGASAARVRVITTREDRASGYVSLDHPSRDFGETAILSVHQEFLSALTPGDRLRFELSGSSEFDGGGDSVWGALAYRMPLGGGGGFGEVYLGSVTARRDARGTLLSTDIEGNTAMLAFGYPVLRDVDTYGYALLEAKRVESNVDVSGTKFDSAVDVVGASWIFGKALPGGGAYEYALNLSVGERTSDAAGFDDGDKHFSHLRVGFGYQHPVSWFGPESAVRAEFWGQYSPDRLPSIEEFYIGGREDERGYRFAEAQGDSGVSATLEVGRDLFPSAGQVRRVRPFGFLDLGYVKNNDPSVDELGEETFASLGLGVDAEFPAGVFVRSYVAAPLTDGPSTGAGDPAFYLGLTKSW
ncbi:ShlB/FhaC/HecB family hemolysin secretion/activation protein [Thioclava electrotropha]|uniref:ShlB/FhaC/HecB family hemolysin secretion/activation protein n=1 Tax=Thioclava electrotropha TaxID=1549850 RepID=A0ABX6YT57_9RHOB|nr:ShlB/FhaC/HecB family hemolysin secretion/activation protein [Thioclava electrotropha]QPZ91014.1 ShlB/FhaC/HecB family hemolysin secretion/activation protein [Thioclava electrotropha]